MIAQAFVETSPFVLKCTSVVFSSAKCHSRSCACMRLGRSVIKLMINDITSTWQTGNHGDTTLNKHHVPTGREGAGERRMR